MEKFSANFCKTLSLTSNEREELQKRLEARFPQPITPEDRAEYTVGKMPPEQRQRYWDIIKKIENA